MQICRFRNGPEKELRSQRPLRHLQIGQGREVVTVPTCPTAPPKREAASATRPVRGVRPPRGVPDRGVAPEPGVAAVDTAVPRRACSQTCCHLGAARSGP